MNRLANAFIWIFIAGWLLLAAVLALLHIFVFPLI
jgi:hypothetical protein